MLSTLKKHIRRNLKVRPIPGLPKFETAWARDELGMSLSKWRKLEKFYYP
jgi:hypothetical protein